MVGMFKTHGAVAFLILSLGLAAVVTGLLAVANAKKRLGAKIGLAALILVTLTCSVTVGVSMTTRLKTDRASMAIDEPERTQFITAGYAAASGLAKMGVGFGVIAFIAAVMGTMRGLAVKEPPKGDEPPPSSMAIDSKREPQMGELSDSTLGLGSLVVGALAFFSIAAAFMPLVMKAPGGELKADDPARKFREAEGLLSDGNVEGGCAALEEGFAQGGDPRRARLRSIEGLIAECFNQRIDRALAASSAEEFAKVVGELETTKMPLDDAQKKRLAEVVEMRKKAAQ